MKQKRVLDRHEELHRLCDALPKKKHLYNKPRGKDKRVFDFILKILKDTIKNVR